MLIALVGNLGSGKTLLLTIFCRKKIDMKRLVYANYHIKGQTKLVEPIDLLDMPQGKPIFLALDEIYAWLDSRCSASNSNRVLSYVALQSRKHKVTIAYTAQLGSSVEMRLRELTDLVIECERAKHGGFIYKITWRRFHRTLSRTLFLSEGIAKKYYSLYDTNEVIKPIGLEKLRKSLEGK